VALLLWLTNTILRIVNPRASQPQSPASPGDVAEVFARARPGRVSLTETYRFKQDISVNPSTTLTKRSGRIEVIVPFDGNEYFPRSAIEDLKHQIGESSDERSSGSGKISAVIGHLALSNIKMANLPDGSPLATRHGAIPLRVPVRSSTINDEVLTFDEKEAVLRTDYVPGVLEHYPLPLTVTAEVFDPEDSEESPGSAYDRAIRNVIRQPAFSSELRLRFQVFLRWPRRRGETMPDARVKRVSLGWPTLTSLEPNSLRFTLGRQPYEMQYNPSAASLEWVGIPVGAESDDDPEESPEESPEVAQQEGGGRDADNPVEADDGREQSPKAADPRSDGAAESTPDGNLKDGEQTDDEDLGEAEDGEIWDLQSKWMNLLLRQPGQLRRQDDLHGTVEIEVTGELLSGIDARLFDATGRRTRPGCMTVRTKLRTDFRLVLEDEFSKRLMSATHTIHFDEVVPDLQRMDDISAVLRDRGFDVERHKKNDSGDDEPPWLIDAERNEGPDTIRLVIVARGRHHRTERRLKTPGWHDYKTEIGSGELTLTVFGEVPRSNRELTTEVNELRQALTDRFNRMKSQR
jgi:hypothetical protein